MDWMLLFDFLLLIVVMEGTTSVNSDRWPDTADQVAAETPLTAISASRRDTFLYCSYRASSHLFPKTACRTVDPKDHGHAFVSEPHPSVRAPGKHQKFTKITPWPDCMTAVLCVHRGSHLYPHGTCREVNPKYYGQAADEISSDMQKTGPELFDPPRRFGTAPRRTTTVTSIVMMSCFHGGVGQIFFSKDSCKEVDGTSYTCSDAGNIYTLPRKACKEMEWPCDIDKYFG